MFDQSQLNGGIVVLSRRLKRKIDIQPQQKTHLQKYQKWTFSKMATFSCHFSFFIVSNTFHSLFSIKILSRSIGNKIDSLLIHDSIMTILLCNRIKNFSCIGTRIIPIVRLCISFHRCNNSESITIYFDLNLFSSFGRLYFVHTLLDVVRIYCN